MSIPSSLQKNARPSVSNALPAVLPPTKTDNWKLDLLAEFKVNHCDWDSEFNTLVQHYIFEDDTADGKPDRNLLLRGCLAHGGAKVLKTICEHEGIKSWCIEGPVKVGEWETLNESGKHGLPIASLKLSNMRFDSATGATLFQALGQLPALNSLILENVGFEGSTFLLGMWDCAPLKLLETIEVTALGSGVDVCPLLLKILEACQLRSLSIEECGSITSDQHAGLAEALHRQAHLSCLKLEIAQCSTPVQFKCYVRFLCGNTSLTKLDLSGCDLGISNCNSLLNALRNKPALTSLSLQGCQLLNDSESERIQIVSVAGMPALRELNLADNYLAEDTMVPLLVALKENKAACLSHLNLSGNNIQPSTIKAMASLLKASRTIVWLSLKRTDVPLIYSEDDLRPLAEALEHNESLLQLDIGWRVANDTNVRLARLLKRNKEIFTAAAMQSGMRALVLERANLSFPNELAGRVFGQGLTQRDALSLSSVNKAAWNWRKKFFHGDDSSM